MVSPQCVAPAMVVNLSSQAHEEYKFVYNVYQQSSILLNLAN